MVRLFLLISFVGQFCDLSGQVQPTIHHGTFKKGRMFMSSNSYKPDKWEKAYYDSSIKSAFPSDLIRHPDRYSDKTIHLIGIVDSVYIDSNQAVTFLLENKYWDYIEDYSIQDEKMFISDKGDGRFLVTVANIDPLGIDEVKNFPAQHKLFMVYGKLKSATESLPILTAIQIRYFDYEFYSTKIFSYDILRDSNGEVVTDKNGAAQKTSLTILRIAKKGQNK